MGNGIDSMAGNEVGFRAMCEAVGKDVDFLDPRALLEKMITHCQGSGQLPRPEGAESSPSSSAPLSLPGIVARGAEAAQPLLTASTASTRAPTVLTFGAEAAHPLLTA